MINIEVKYNNNNCLLSYLCKQFLPLVIKKEADFMFIFNSGISFVLRKYETIVFLEKNNVKYFINYLVFSNNFITHTHTHTHTHTFNL